MAIRENRTLSNFVALLLAEAIVAKQSKEQNTEGR